MLMLFFKKGLVILRKITKHANFWEVQHPLKEIFSDSNNIFLWHKSEDINKKAYFQNFN